MTTKPNKKNGRPKGSKQKRVTQKDLHNYSIDVIQKMMNLVIEKIHSKDLTNNEFKELKELLYKMENVLYGYKQAEIHRNNLKKARLKLEESK